MIPGQNPMTADITGRLPLFYVPDGVYRVRLVDQYGVGIYDYPQVASIGASASGGGGGSVDPTTIFQTGDELFQKVFIVRPGWLPQNGLTIGSGVSGGSERANADCLNLFLFLWNNYTDGHCPVVGGRGASAAADWAANKQITLPDMRGRAPHGLDGMGNARANVLPDSSVTSAGDTGDTPGATGGEPWHVLIATEMPVHTHGVTDPQHAHDFNTYAGVASPTPGGTAGNSYVSSAQAGATTSSATGITINNAGGGGSHNNMEPFIIGCWYIKM